MLKKSAINKPLKTAIFIVKYNYFNTRSIAVSVTLHAAHWEQ